MRTGSDCWCAPTRAGSARCGVAAGARTALLTRYMREVPPVVCGREVAIDSRGGAAAAGAAGGAGRMRASCAWSCRRRAAVRRRAARPWSGCCWPATPRATPPRRPGASRRSTSGAGPMEEFFRVLQSGARIEDRRLRTAAALAKCLAFDAITAWRVFEAGRITRDAPHTPAGGHLHAAGAGRDPHHGRGGKAAAPGCPYCRSCPRRAP